MPKDVGLFNPSENPVHISVHTFDAKNNPLGRGGDQVVISVHLDNDLVATPTVTDVGDGSYTATWTVQSPANNYRVSITVNGTEIDHSPFPRESDPVLKRLTPLRATAILLRRTPWW